MQLRLFICWSESRSVMPNSFRPHAIVRGILQAKTVKWVAIPFFRKSSQARDQGQVSCIAGDSFPAKPQGKTLLNYTWEA